MIFDDFKAKARWNYGDDTLLFTLRALFSDASLSMIFYRSMSCLSRHRLTRWLAAVIGKLNAVMCGAVIGRDARFQAHFVILHSVGIVINSKVVAGDDIILESVVVIGEEKNGVPQLGDHIFIGSGAKLFGNIRIGNNVSIGANAVVNKDVPDDVVVAGVPARIVRRKNSGQSPLPSGA